MPADVVVPARARRFAALLGLDPESLTALAGATGEVFGAGDVVLRLGSAARLDVEVTAACAAGTVVPVADVLDRVDAEDGSAVLLRRVPGRVALDLADPAADPVRDHPGWRALVAGWSAGAGLDDLDDDDARAWGCRFLLADLGGRRTAAELAPARAELARLEVAAATRVD